MPRMPQHAEYDSYPMSDMWLLYRWWKLWKQDVREGWEILGRYRVRYSPSVVLRKHGITCLSAHLCACPARCSTPQTLCQVSDSQCFR